ncbi:tudor domain-containing protein 1-like isoform X2 [Macrobrachium nipponense]|uniref:tudor domain-containing protein 1-like isoform X2 n=1 Tax=Macrobrachium nipponense TaxID=159736 RepID=UPI0030C7C577
MSLGSKIEVEPGSYVPTQLSYVSKACFYVNLLERESLIQTIRETLMETNEGANENNTSKCLSIGDLVSVLDEADQLWHRGRVLGCFGPLTEVFLIDSGKDIVAERNMLQELPNSPLVTDSPAQAIKCTLSDRNISVGHFVSMQHDVGRQFLTYFENEEDGLWKVKLYVERVYSTKSLEKEIQLYSTKILEKEVLNSSRSRNSHSDGMSEDFQIGAGFKLCTTESDSGSCTGINLNAYDDDSTSQSSSANETTKTSFYSNFEKQGHSKTKETRVSLRLPKCFGNYASPEFHAELTDSEIGADTPSPSDSLREEVCNAFKRSSVILREQENVIVKTLVTHSPGENKAVHASCNIELDAHKDDKRMMNSVLNETLNDLPCTQNIDSKKCLNIPEAQKSCNVEFSAIISNFEDGIVWVQAIDQISLLNKFMNQINEMNTECLKTYKEKPCINTPCLSLYREDQRFYRAIVKDLTEDTDRVLVHYVDYGNSEITEVSSLRAIPDSFLDMPCKAIQCYFPTTLKEQLLQVFHKETGKIFNEELKITLAEDPLEKDTLILKSCIISGIDIVARIHEEHENNCRAPEDGTITVMSHESQVSEVSSTCFQIPYLSIKYDTEMSVYVTQVDNTGKFWIQVLDHFSLLDEMMEKLNDFAVSSDRTILTSPMIGKPCLCCYAKDDLFYRAEITKVNQESGSAMVHYIDYGDTGEVEISNLFVMPEQFFTLPRQAICCYFSSKIRKKWFSSTQQYLEKLLEKEIDLTLMLEVEGFEQRNVVKKLTLEGNDVISHMTLLATNDDADGEVLTENDESEDVLFEEDIPEILLSYDGSVEGIVSHVEGSCIWIQLSDQITAIEEMQEQLNSSSLQPLAEVPFVGSVCISYFPEDERFYRAVVKEVDLSCQSVVVHYIDYGNSSHVEMKDLYVLPLDLMCLPKQAIQCCFSGNFSPCSKAFKKSMKELLNQEVTVSISPNFGEGGKNILHSCIVDNTDILCEGLNASNEEGTESLWEVKSQVSNY